MGKNRLFIPQDTLDQWVDADRADVEDNELTLADDGKVYHLAPAVLFLREATGVDDPYDLVGRVKEETKLDILGADAYMDSVILEDNAYDVRRGFVAVPALDPTIKPSERISRLPPPPTSDAEDDLIIDDPPVFEDNTPTQPEEGPAHTTEPPPAEPPPADGDNGEGEGDELAKLLLRSLK